MRLVPACAAVLLLASCVPDTPSAAAPSARRRSQNAAALTTLNIGEQARAAGFPLNGDPVIDVPLGAEARDSLTLVIVENPSAELRFELHPYKRFSQVQESTRNTAAAYKGFTLVSDEPDAIVAAKTRGGKTTWGVFVEARAKDDRVVCLNSNVTDEDSIELILRACRSYRYREPPPAPPDP